MSGYEIGRPFRVGTGHGTLLAVDRETGALLHAAATAMHGRLVPVLAYRPASHPTGLFLTAAPRPSDPAPGAVTLTGDDLAGAMLSFDVIGTGDGGSFALRHPSTRRFLCADPPEASSGCGGASVTRDEVGGWESFAAAEPEPDDAEPASLVELGALDRRAALFEPASLTALMERALMERGSMEGADPHLLSLLKALLPLQSDPVLRDFVRQISHLPIYGALFPIIRRQLARGEPWFQYNTIAGLSGPIAARGWIIGAHSYGVPEIVDGEYGHLTIGKYCSIAGSVRVILGNHLINTASSYPFGALARFWPSAPENVADHLPGDVVIGNSVWIGLGATILPGARIGDGVIVGAGTVVRGTVPPYSVVAGNPGRVVRQRFDERTTERLLATQWWDWPDHRVDRYVPLLLDENVAAFLDAAERAEHENPSIE
jgi:acetyltransferase-like isoleucine patch superfamily enzyme